MLFFNISTDKIHCVVDGHETLIEHGDLEKTVADFLYAQKPLVKAFIINGPGSFTNIRIATLALNLYNFLHKLNVEFYTIDKLTLYKKLYQLHILPRTGYIYIGQKRNRRKVDLETMSHEMVQIIDNDDESFVDEVFDGEKSENMMHLSRKGDALSVGYKGVEHEIPLSELDLKPTKTLEANYMMEPNVTMKSFA